jgi:hypothetical protein
MSDEAKIARGRELLFERVGDDTAVLDLASGEYTRLNATGTLLWDALSEPTTAAALEQRLVGAFGIDRETARRDVGSFVASLRERGLLTAPAQA